MEFDLSGTLLAVGSGVFKSMTEIAGVAERSLDSMDGMAFASSSSLSGSEEGTHFCVFDFIFEVEPLAEESVPPAG